MGGGNSDCRMAVTLSRGGGIGAGKGILLLEPEVLVVIEFVVVDSSAPRWYSYSSAAIGAEEKGGEKVVVKGDGSILDKDDSSESESTDTVAMDCGRC